MNVGRIFGAVCIVCGLLLVAGCGGQKVDVPQEVVAHVDAICTSLMRGGAGFRHAQGAATTDRLFLDIPDAAVRRAAALHFGRRLLSVDLKSLAIHPRASVTGLFGDYICQCFRLMCKCGVEPSRAMDFFFKGFTRFRSSCLDVPAGPRREGESRREYRLRQYYARLFKEIYVYVLSIVQRFWLPNLSRYLPPEYHDEFRRRLKAFELPEASAAPAAPSNRAVSEP